MFFFLSLVEVSWFWFIVFFFKVGIFFGSFLRGVLDIEG